MAPRMILCLGPHRSGTSMVAAALQSLGAELAIAQDRVSDENPRGFFEQPEIVAFNDALLSVLGASWDSPTFECERALQAAGLDEGTLDGLIDDGAALLRRLFAAAPMAAVKDPRICRLLPIWHRILSAAGYDAQDLALIHVLRDPAEAACSQMLRQQANPDFYDIGRNAAEGVVLWLTHAAQALQDSGCPRNLVVAHAAMLSAPRQTLDRIAGFLEVQVNTDRRDTFTSTFIDEDLYRSRPDRQMRDRLAKTVPTAFALHDSLERYSRSGGFDATAAAQAAAIYRTPDARREVMQIAAEAADRLAWRWRETARAAEQLRDRLDEQGAQLAALDEELARQKHDAEAEQNRLRNDYEAVIEPLRETLRIAEHDKAALAAQIDDLDAELARQKHDAEAEQNRLRNDYEAVIEPLRETLRHTEGENEALNAQVAATEAERTRMRNAMEAEQARLVTAFEAEMAKRADLAAAALNAEIAKREALLASRSWRLTAPLRRAGSLAASVRATPARAWRRLNQAARLGYRRLAARNPELASRIRWRLWPILQAGNRRLLGMNHVPLNSSSARELQHHFQRPGPTGSHAPLVSVIVPNYNHAQYLRQRLDSIFGQSYRNFEVILLDDCSQDESRAILKEYATRFADRTRMIFNEENSGGVFHQWEKGIQAARGDLVWIAESDDWCTQNMLEVLVPYFANPAVQLAYVPTDFMDESGTQRVWSMDEFLADLHPARWHNAWVATAPEVMRSGFAVRNIVPNVSSAVFRRMDRLDVLGSDQWKTMRCCGDWLFYIHLIRGGLMAYAPHARNFFRQHPQNTSVASYTRDDYYREHEIVASATARHYGIDPVDLESQRTDLMEHWRRNRGGFDPAAFESCYNTDRIALSGQERAPNLLMVGYGFCAGGGETFPIHLANTMKAAGYNVTYLDCAQEAENGEIRDMLARDIPVVSNFEDLNGIVAAFDIDIIHSHHAWVDNTILDLLAEDTTARTVVTLHGMYETILDRDLQRILPRLVARSGRLIYTAEKNLDAFLRHGLVQPGELERIDNALGRYPVTPVDRAELGIPESAFVLTLVARAMPEKGWAEAIEAVGMARDLSGADIRLILIGDGAVHDRLRKEGVPDHVRLEGFRQNIRAYFASSDMGFLPSRYRGESFPLVVIDCLHAGCPVLASAIGEIPYMLETGSGPAGVLFELDNWSIPTADLAERIAHLATNRSEYEELRARVPEASARFDPQVMRARYDVTYRGLLRDPAPRNGRTAERHAAE